MTAENPQIIAQILHIFCIMSVKFQQINKSIKKPQKVTVKQVYRYDVYSSTNEVLVEIGQTHD